MRPRPAPLPWVTHRLPSGPTAMAWGPLPRRSNCATVPDGLRRATLLVAGRVNQRLPSGPAMIWRGRSRTGSSTVSSVTMPAGLMRATFPPMRLDHPEVAVGPAGQSVGLQAGGQHELEERAHAQAGGVAAGGRPAGVVFLVGDGGAAAAGATALAHATGGLAAALAVDTGATGALVGGFAGGAQGETASAGRRGRRVWRSAASGGRARVLVSAAASMGSSISLRGSLHAGATATRVTTIPHEANDLSIDASATLAARGCGCLWGQHDQCPLRSTPSLYGSSSPRLRGRRTG